MSDRRDLNFGKGLDGKAIWAAFRRDLFASLSDALPPSMKFGVNAEETAP